MEASNRETSSSADTEASSLAPAIQEYDVFLSFRGEDTRYNFVSHLDERLTKKGIHTFKDDRELERGKSIAGALPEAIKKSRMAIVVFSENYAHSSWCLDELFEIVNNRLMILPVFYKLNPSDIEEQTGAVAKAFVEHERKFKGEEIQRWKKALSEVATVSGWDSNNWFDEVDLIKCIVREVLTKLYDATSPPFEDLVDLVDIDSHVSRIEELLDVKHLDSRMIGIWGTGGIGKTTIAKFIFYKHGRNLDSDGFHSSCFLENVKDEHRKVGDIGLQKEFIHQLLGGFDTNINIRIVADGCNSIRKMFSQKKVFIVIDDVDDLKQLDFLVKILKWFGHGSRIIITTRDKHLLDVKEVRHIYEVQPLNFYASLKLFSKHAFHQDQPANNFWDLSKRFVTYAQGLPLVLKVLGTLLYGFEMHEWQSELEKLNRFSNPNIHQALKVSYDGLKDSFTKDVFLDVAFFFVEEDIDKIENILREYGCSPLSAIRTLKDRTLVTIDDYNRLRMHDRIQQMAHLIVEEESKSVYERSRLSCIEDVSSLLMMMGEEVEDQEKWRVEGVSLLDASKIDEKIYLKPNVFKKFCHLRILKFCMPWRANTRVFGGELGYLPHGLWYLHWDCFPFNNWPSTFYAKHLVELRLRRSKLEYLWSGEVELGKLKVIDLSYSKRLKTCPNLSRATNIEEINLKGCKSLIEFSSDLQYLIKLTHLNFNCKKLHKFPDLPPKVLHLRLSGITMTKAPLEMKLLNFEYTDTQMIGIVGEDGVGKTTFAKSIFQKCFHEFDYSCFLEDYKDNLQEVGLQKELLNKLFGGFDESIHTMKDRQVLISDRLRNKRFLIVLDDVRLRHFELIKSLKLFNHGGRIIISARRIPIWLVGEGFHCIYAFERLDRDGSLELFSRCAFKQDQPPKDYLELSYGFINYTKGLPLAIRLLGSLLYGLGIHDWKSKLDRLKRSPCNKRLNLVLRMSYEGLKDDFVKEVFLDIAFFFIGESEVRVQNILDRYDGKQRDAIRILKERGLITSDCDGIHMHRLIRRLAHEIARERSQYPWKCSRLSYEKTPL